jgi:hypothetical protein
MNILESFGHEKTTIRKENNMLYRLSTERLNVPGIREIVEKTFDAYTLIEGNGVWKGVAENSIMIEIDTDVDKRPFVLLIAEHIKKVNKQEAVLIQEFNTTNILI